MTFIAGSYTATYGGGSNPLGTIQQGFTIEGTLLGEPIVGDNLGGSTQDGVYTGANFTIEMILQDWNLAAVQDLMWPVDPTWGTAGQVGRLWFNIAKELVLTAVPGTTAITETATFTASKALLVPDFPLRHILRTGLRNLPVRLMLLPTLSGAAGAGNGTETTTWFTTT